MTSVQQRHPAPNMNAVDRVFGKNALGRYLRVVRTSDRAVQVQLRAAIVNKADRAQYSVDDAKSSETIDVDGRNKCALHNEFFVVHAAIPQLDRPQHQSTSGAKTKKEMCRAQRIRFRVAPCLVSGSSASLSFDGAQV